MFPPLDPSMCKIPRSSTSLETLARQSEVSPRTSSASVNNDSNWFDCNSVHVLVLPCALSTTRSATMSSKWNKVRIATRLFRPTINNALDAYDKWASILSCARDPIPLSIAQIYIKYDSPCRFWISACSKLLHCRSRRLLSSYLTWKSCSCCGSDLQRGGDEFRENQTHSCANTECGLLCKVDDCFGCSLSLKWHKSHHVTCYLLLSKKKIFASDVTSSQEKWLFVVFFLQECADSACGCNQLVALDDV